MNGCGMTDWIATCVLGASNYCIELTARAASDSGADAARGWAPAAAHACVRRSGH
jgi:hypothetical protein